MHPASRGSFVASPHGGLSMERALPLPNLGRGCGPPKESLLSRAAMSRSRVVRVRIDPSAPLAPRRLWPPPHRRDDGGSDCSRRPARLGGYTPMDGGGGTLLSHGPRPPGLPWSPFLSCRPRGPRRDPRRPWDEGGASRGSLRRSGSGPACRMWNCRGSSDELCLRSDPTVASTSRLGFGLAASSRTSCFGREPSRSTVGTRTLVVTHSTGARRDDST